ncbi:MAG: preprotein translocase subunit YajC [Flavobacteriales bacterium]|nr:preprotein translocase subunit YajC [Flavobacteriales bacterium]
MSFSTVLLQAAAPAQSPLPSIIMIGLMILVFYFFMIRPQARKAKEAKKFREGLEKGQRIVTIGGIHGKIEEIKDTTVVIVTEGGGKLRVEKGAISQEFTGGIDQNQQ